MDDHLRQRLTSATVIVTGVLGAAVFSGVLGDRAALHLANLGQCVAPAAAAAGCWWASRRAVLPAERWSWRLLGASAASWSVGQVIWTYHEVTGTAPFPSLADIGFLGAVPLALGGVWSLALRASTSTRLVAAVDGLIIGGSVLAISWPLVLEPSWRAGGEGLFPLALSLAYPIGNVVVASSVLLALVRSSRHRGGMPLVIITVALLTLVAADSTFVWLAARGTEQLLSVADAGWFVGYGLLLGASLHYPLSVEGETTVQRDAMAFRRALLPLTVTGLALVVQTTMLAAGRPADPFLSVLTVVVVGLVLVRHLMTMRENQSLTWVLEEKINELTSREEQLTHQAFHDPLTGLANRRLFGDRVEHALQRSRRTGERTAVLFVDLDDFKTVNDSLGHAVGDRLLVAVAARLSGCVRPGDTVARLGGDEFGVLLEELEGPDQAAVVAARILDALDVAFPLAGRQVFTRASIGLAHAEDAGSSHVLADADVALYAAKAAGKATFRQFEGAMRRTAVERLELSQDLRRGLALDQFLCHYQPIVDLVSGEVTAIEALVRWQHPERGLLEPGSFIEMAEEIGSIDQIGLQVLRSAAAQAEAWQRAGLVPADVDLHVNLSGRQLEDVELAATVAGVLDAAGLPPELLVVEVTESVAVDLAADHRARLLELRDLGVRLAIDDFGAGHSSLSYLRDLPVDVLKVDGSFARPAEGTADHLLLEAIVKLGQALGIEVVAEGIEGRDQVAILVDLGCRRAQGYHFSPPVPAVDLPALLRTGATTR